MTVGISARESNQAIDEAAFSKTLRSAVLAVVERQIEAGIDIVSDGEMSKISYATYIKDRISGFDGDSPRSAPRDLEEYPSFLQRQAMSGGTPTYKRPRCVGAISYINQQPLKEDISNLKEAMEKTGVEQAFMNAASPGVIALFQPNEYYASHEAYLYALADAMRVEYEAIVAAGLTLQLDSPDLGLGRHMMFKDREEADYVRLANMHIDALNYALQNVPAERVRLHVCWGNYEGPHHHDVPMDIVLPVVLRAKPAALLFESANPRHNHEWTVFRDLRLPDDKVLVPGVIDTTTNFVEHPELVAQRISRFYRHRWPGAGDCRDRLRILHLCGLWCSRRRHRLCEIANIARGRGSHCQNDEGCIVSIAADFRQRMVERHPLLGTFVKTPSPIVAEVLANSQLDCLCFDAEHAPLGRETLDLSIAMSSLKKMPALVRVPVARPEIVLNALDCGAAGIVAPHIRSVADATALAAACKFRGGGRGFAGSSRSADYGGKSMSGILEAGNDVSVIAQIEDVEAVDAVSEIAQVEGIDCLFVGRMDLTVALGASDPTDPVVVEAVERVCQAGKDVERAVGMFVADLDEIPRWLDAGASLFLLMSDHSFMLQGAARLRAGFDVYSSV